MLTAPEASKGTFSYAAPDKVRWEYTSPSPITVVIAGDEMTTWYRDLKRAETLKVGRYSSQVFKFLGASGSMDTRTLAWAGFSLASATMVAERIRRPTVSLYLATSWLPAIPTAAAAMPQPT